MRLVPGAGSTASSPASQGSGRPDIRVQRPGVSLRSLSDRTAFVLTGVSFGEEVDALVDGIRCGRLSPLRHAGALDPGRDSELGPFSAHEGEPGVELWISDYHRRPQTLIPLPPISRDRHERAFTTAPHQSSAADIPAVEGPELMARKDRNGGDSPSGAHTPAMPTGQITMPEPWPRPNEGVRLIDSGPENAQNDHSVRLRRQYRTAQRARISAGTRASTRFRADYAA